MLGTTLSRHILEAMSDQQFRHWAGRLITTVAGYYILYGSWLLLAHQRLCFLTGGYPMTGTADPRALNSDHIAGMHSARH
jgi:hypothetical protein